MTNSQIADAFDEIAEILDFLGENPFRVRAYRNSARAIRDHATPMAALVEEGETVDVGAEVCVIAADAEEIESAYGEEAA